MSAQPSDSPEPYEVIHLGGQAAAIVPLTDLRRLRAVERRASAEAREDGEIEAVLDEHDERAVRAGGRTTTSWLSCLAAIENRVDAGGGRVRTPTHARPERHARHRRGGRRAGRRPFSCAA